MTDETETTTDETTEQAETDSKTEKTYTEAELQAIVKDRVAREKKISAAAASEIETIKSAHADELGKYKSIVDARLEDAKKSLPDAVQKLLEKLDALEQLEWLADPENVKPVERTKIPETPEGGGEEPTVESHPKLPFGLGR